MKALFIKDWKLLKNQGKMDEFLLIGDNTAHGWRWCRPDRHYPRTSAFRTFWLISIKEVIAFGQHTPTDHRLAERNAY